MPPTREEAFAAAKDFIQPALAPKSAQLDGRTAAEVIAISVSLPGSLDGRRQVILRACALLIDLYSVSNSLIPRETPRVAVLDTNEVAVLYPLLDLLLIEGIYPALSPGVGIPEERQRRSTLCDRAVKHFPDLGALPDVTGALNAVCFPPGAEATSFAFQLRDRITIDLIAANADISWSPLRHEDDRAKALPVLNEILNSISVSRLYPDLTALIRPAAPLWLRSSVTEILSLLPLRPRGVRHFIEFIARQYYVPSSEDAQKPPDGKNFSISPEGITQICRVLSSVPKSLDFDAYFTRLAPQLLHILDGAEGVGLSKVSAIVITNGILSKRSIGSPGTPGWRLFVEPIQQTLEPKTLDTVISEDAISVAQHRLWELVQSHPSPALTGRMVRPLMASLWAITTFKTPTTSTSMSLVASEILKSFLRRCATLPILQWFIAHMTWDGPEQWTVAPSPNGGVELRKREVRLHEPSVFEQLSAIHNRIEIFLGLISGGTVEMEVIGELFLGLTRASLLPEQSTTRLASSEDSLQSLIRAQLLQGILQRFGSKLATNTVQTFELIRQLLEEAVKDQTLAQKSDQHITREKLSRIVEPDVSNTRAQPGWSALDDKDDLVSTAVSLLNTLVAANTDISETARTMLLAILQNLESLETKPPPSLSLGTVSSIASAISLLKSRLSTDDQTEPRSRTDEKQVLEQIRVELASPLPPTRAAALTRLRSLILDTPSGQQLDVPATTLMLLNLIQTDPDSFVHQAATSAIGVLAVAKDTTGFVLRTFVDAFADKSERSDLDARLRVGEAVSTIIEDVRNDEGGGKRTYAKTIQFTATSLLVIAGRRGKRTREVKEREKLARLDRLKQKQAEKAWGGQIPNLSELEDQDPDGDYDETAENEAQAVVTGWADTGPEEDVRIRASALSLLSTILESHGITDVDEDSMQNVAEIVCNILTIERDARKAVLRRAAVLICMVELQAENSALEEASHGRMARWDGKTWIKIEKVLLQSLVDEDEIVKGHAQTVLESLDAFRLRQIVRQAAERNNFESPDLGLTSLRGLDVSLSQSSSRPKIQEIE